MNVHATRHTMTMTICNTRLCVMNESENYAKNITSFVLATQNMYISI